MKKKEEKRPAKGERKPHYTHSSEITCPSPPPTPQPWLPTAQALSRVQHPAAAVQASQPLGLCPMPISPETPEAEGLPPLRQAEGSQKGHAP